MEEPLNDAESVMALPEAHGVAVEHGEPDGDRVTLFVKLGDGVVETLLDGLVV